MQYTPEQERIIEAVKSSSDNLMIRARAGCGKTTTLYMIDEVTKNQPKLLLCFNKAIADEAAKRMNTGTVVATLNSIGHKIWSSQVSGVRVLPNKTYLIFSELYGGSTARFADIWAAYDEIASGVRLAKAVGYIPDKHIKAKGRLCDFNSVELLLDEPPTPDVREAIDRILTVSIARAYSGAIDFDDQCYMPALFGGSYPRYPIVMVDEYQDLSPVNRAMLAKLCKSSRQIGVGDEAQAIYGFRGADIHAMSEAVEQFNMAEYPLSVSFRCRQAITDNVHWHVPDITAMHPGGRVETSNELIIKAGTVVICRNNAPLLNVATTIMARGISVNIVGVDINQHLDKQLRKLGPESLTQAQVIDAIDKWLAEKEGAGSKTAEDTAASMKVIAEKGKTLGQMLAYIKKMTERSSDDIRFMTGHKAKGLEFDHVYHLDKHLLNYHDQDDNLHYVIDTRARNQLTYIETRGK